MDPAGTMDLWDEDGTTLLPGQEAVDWQARNLRMACRSDQESDWLARS